VADVTVECRACGNEQLLVLQLDMHYTDDQLAEQLDAAPQCDNCHETDWSVMEVRG